MKVLPAKSFLLILVVVGFLSACAASQNASGIPADRTAAPAPSGTPDSRSVAVPTATRTPTPIPTPDVRVIDQDPFDLLLRQSDLPAEAGYHLPGPEWISPRRNAEILSQMGAASGQEYIDQTGRVDGWWVYYERAGSGGNASEEIYDSVILFKTQAGAQLYLDRYSTCKDYSSLFTQVPIDFVLGDKSVACIARTKQPGGAYRMDYVLAFVYRNVSHQVLGWGWESQVKPEYVRQVAEILLERLKAAPLGGEVTFQP